MGSMNSGALSSLEPKPITFMEETISDMVKASEGICHANDRITSILKRLRGSVPEDEEVAPERKEDIPNCHMNSVKKQLRDQNIMLNRMHNMLDELMKLM